MHAIIGDWLITERLELVVTELCWAEEIFNFYIRNKEHLEPWEPTKEPGFFSLEYHEMLAKEYEKEFKRGNSLRLWVKERGSSLFIGAVNLTQIIYDPFLSCYMGYKMDKDHMGKGYMTEAVSQAIALAFEVYGLHRVEASIMPRNKASRKVLLANGFQKEGYSPRYLKINGIWEDHERYAILNEDREY